MFRARRHPPVTPVQQLLRLRKDFPAGSGTVRREHLRWDCALSPSPLSREYLVRLEYSFAMSPTFVVLQPDLRLLASGKIIPHLYSQERCQLCLYLPRSGEWRPSLFLSKTIVPWACEWLLHFEAWILTGVWEEGGVHPR